MVAGVDLESGKPSVKPLKLTGKVDKSSKYSELSFGLKFTARGEQTVMEFNDNDFIKIDGTGHLVVQINSVSQTTAQFVIDPEVDLDDYRQIRLYAIRTSESGTEVMVIGQSQMNLTFEGQTKLDQIVLPFTEGSATVILEPRLQTENQSNFICWLLL